MLELPDYSPSQWIDAEGLLIRMSKRVATTVKRLARRGQWSHKIAQTVVAISVGASTSGYVGLELPPSHVAQMDLFASAWLNGDESKLPEVDDDLVPLGYWDALTDVMRRAEKLPAPDLSRDPPALV